jgi:hypothetical protein
MALPQDARWRRAAHRPWVRAETLPRVRSLVLSLLLVVTSGTSAGAAESPKWDQVANIRDAAERLGRLHRARGAKAAYEFIDACYRTHSLAEAYGQAFESCIAQDFLETTVLAQLYTRMPPDTLRKLGAPTPQVLTQAMGRRVGAAFAQYNIPAEYGQDLKKLVDEHGLPVFIGIVFPQVVNDLKQGPSKSKKQPVP